MYLQFLVLCSSYIFLSNQKYLTPFWSKGQVKSLCLDNYSFELSQISDDPGPSSNGFSRLFCNKKRLKSQLQNHFLLGSPVSRSGPAQPPQGRGQPARPLKSGM